MDRKIIGCREFVGFPEWGIASVEAKIDTGARTSALHVDNIRQISPSRVRFEVVLSRKKPNRRTRVEARIVRHTRVRSSTGHVQQRYVVAARMRIGRLIRSIEVSLVCRKHMLCRMLLGRTAMRGFLIDPDARYLVSHPKLEKQKKKKIGRVSA